MYIVALESPNFSTLLYNLFVLIEQNFTTIYTAEFNGGLQRVVGTKEYSLQCN